MAVDKTKTFTYGDISFTIDPLKPRVVVKMGSLKTTMKKSDLWQMAFLITKDKEKQADLIPVTKRPMMKITRLFKIKATKDLKAGDIIEFHTDIDVPLAVVDSVLKEHGKTLEDIIPKEDIVSATDNVDTQT